uniref:Uncharacterized protein n=1 Tax=viral metagenome TaxID=1070528 RepID=A0A6M3XR61_9ZZZZ
MGFLAALQFPEAEWTALSCGGVVGMFNGKERPRKYEPQSQSVKQFGLFVPEEDLIPIISATGGSFETGTYTVTYVEVDSRANNGQGLVSGPPRETVLDQWKFSILVAGWSVTLRFPPYMTNPDADERWVYASLPDGSWPVLGRIARVPAGTTTFTWTGGAYNTSATVDGKVTEPDFDNFPLDQNRYPAPNKNYPVKLKRRLFLWGSEPLETRFVFTVGSDEATYASGDMLDAGCIGMVVYPEGEVRGYQIEGFYEGSPPVIKMNDKFVGTEASSDTHPVMCKLCRPSGELRWSEPDDYENFPASSVRYAEMAGGDPETGCAAINGRGLFFTVRKTFALDFDTYPNVGWGSLQEISTSVGCLSHRSIQECNGALLWLAEGGFVASTGGNPQFVSDDIQPLFADVIRDSLGRVRDAFALNWRAEKKYICCVPRAGDSVGCSYAFVCDYSPIPGEPNYRWSIYSFSKEFTCGSMELHTVTETADDGTETTSYYEYPILGDKDGYVWTFGVGTADGPESGTVSGTITAADTIATSPTLFTDADASFDTDGLGLAGMMVTFERASDEEKQELLVASNTGDTLRFDGEWDTWTPAAGDAYWIGGIDSHYETGWSSLGGDAEQKKLHRLVSTYNQESSGEVTVKVYKDFSTTAISLTNEGETSDLTTARDPKRLSGAAGFYFKFRWENEKPDQPWTLRAATAVVRDRDEAR